VKKTASTQDASKIEHAWSEAEEPDKVIVTPLALISEDNSSKKGKKKVTNKPQSRYRALNPKKLEEGPRSHQYVEQEDVLRLLHKHQPHDDDHIGVSSILPDIASTSSSYYQQSEANKFTSTLPTFLPAIVEDGDSDSYSDVGSKWPATVEGISISKFNFWIHHYFV